MWTVSALSSYHTSAINKSILFLEKNVINLITWRWTLQRLEKNQVNTVNFFYNIFSFFHDNSLNTIVEYLRSDLEGTRLI